jgi:hypothetical protein
MFAVNFGDITVTQFDATSDMQEWKKNWMLNCSYKSWK